MSLTDFDDENCSFASQIRGIYNVFTIITFAGEIKLIHLVILSEHFLYARLYGWCSEGHKKVKYMVPGPNPIGIKNLYK